MERQRRQQRAMLLSALGIAIVAPLALMPASASSGSSGMFVHAWDTSEPEIEAVAGTTGMSKGGLPNPVSPGGSIPGGGSGSTEGAPGAGQSPDGNGSDTSAVLFTYECGPASFAITQSMVDFSKANKKLQDAGRASEMKVHPDGWTLLSHFNGASWVEGFPTDGSEPLATIVGDGQYKSAAMKAEGLRIPGDQCAIVDMRKPSAGKISNYSLTASGTRSEARYATVEGRLINVSSSVSPVEKVRIVQRANIDQSVFRSEKTPAKVTLGNDGSIQVEVYMPSTRDDYNYIYFDIQPDGSGTVAYRNFVGMTPWGTKDTRVAARKEGPATVSFDSSGRPTSAQWGTEGDKLNNIPLNGGQDTLIERYNAGSGQNWDGSYAKVSDFDLSVPFEPSPGVLK